MGSARRQGIRHRRAVRDRIRRIVGIAGPRPASRRADEARLHDGIVLGDEALGIGGVRIDDAAGRRQPCILAQHDGGPVSRLEREQAERLAAAHLRGGAHAHVHLGVEQGARHGQLDILLELHLHGQGRRIHLRRDRNPFDLAQRIALGDFADLRGARLRHLEFARRENRGRVGDRLHLRPRVEGSRIVDADADGTEHDGRRQGKGDGRVAGLIADQAPQHAADAHEKVRAHIFPR